MSNLISVVVCTYNRADLIAGCLESLVEQTADVSLFEVIVVDNNSTDDTIQIVENCTHLSNLRLVKEQEQGLSYARNRGFQEAKGTYVAYLDDDARAEKHYIENIHDLINHSSTTIDCFGGPILPFYTSHKPDWFKDSYETRRLRPEAEFLKPKQSFSGSNMIWNRELLIELGGFNPEFGVKGKQLILGEETDLFNRLWKVMEPSLLFSPDLVVYHWVPSHKLKICYRVKRAFAIGQALASIETNHIIFNEKIKLISWWFKRIIIVGFKASIHVFRHQSFQNWVEEEILPVMILLGKLFGILGFQLKMLQRKN
jgi:glucosyl-dolichyl phosphate glucuronosyltransferase